MAVNCPSCEGQIEIPRGTAPQAPDASVPATPEKPQAAVFYVGRGGTELGQFSEQEFRDRILTGNIRPGDHYWKEGMDDWQLVSEYRGLPSPTTPPTLPPLTRMPETKKKRVGLRRLLQLVARVHWWPLLHHSLALRFSFFSRCRFYLRRSCWLSCHWCADAWLVASACSSAFFQR